MAKRWYVVHTFSGFEHKVKAALEERIKALGKQELFGDIMVPMEKVVELVKGKKKTSSRKFFPGYILVQVELDDETWHIVKETPKVTGFVGDSTHPSPVSDEEIKMITQQIEEGAIKPKPRVLFSVGESVKVVDGPFADFNGVVEDVRPDKGKLRVLISIFGRATPVELDFVQVERN
ncbi:MAG: transcription termination/antitermination protein NusG [Deltaproteobacteria bacterium]|jgi:transcriptional antiterminator NusG|nr:transcription termination/antitermination protein NusG [Deltaproteobacteria bacterium]